MDNNFNKLDGSLLAARYAFMPNKLRYCGGDKNKEIFNYVAHSESDPGLTGLLEEFATMYPYLKMIAEANKIFNPFNYKVVEAYWIGNELLQNVSMKNFYRYMVDDQKLKKKFKPKLMEKVFNKIPYGAKPHHSWHVFNIPKRTGHYPVEHSLETMDDCRIAAGQIKNSISGKMIVDYQPLVFEDNKITLGETKEREVYSEMNDKAFVREPKAGDWVSIHWSWVCDFLTETQVKNLEKWTKYNLVLFNI